MAEKKESRIDPKNQPYHVSKRAHKEWIVKRAGSDNVIKIFETREEAVDFCTKMGDNQNVKVIVHKSKGENKGKISDIIK